MPAIGEISKLKKDVKTCCLKAEGLEVQNALGHSDEVARHFFQIGISGAYRIAFEIELPEIRVRDFANLDILFFLFADHYVSFFGYICYYYGSGSDDRQRAEEQDKTNSEKRKHTVCLIWLNGLPLKVLYGFFTRGI